MMNRKLIRPNLAEIKERMSKGPAAASAEATSREPVARRNGRLGPPDSTHAEAFYYLKQMNTQTPMIVVLNDGEQLRGHIEWYDRSCLKVHREDGPNLLIFKHAIKFLFKAEEETDH